MAKPVLLAPLHQRLFALLLDYLFVVMALNLVDQLTLGEFWDLRTFPESAWPKRLFWFGGFFLLFLIRDGWRGRGPGKFLAGIAVRDAAHPSALPGFGRLALRNLGLLLLPVEGYLVFTDGYCRRLGDRWARSVVVIPERVPPLSRRLLLATSLVLGILLAAFLVGPWNMKRTAAWQTGLQAIEAHAELAARAGAPFALGESPLFDLRLTPGGGEASIQFTAEGPEGEVAGQVDLRLDRNRHRWEVVAFSIEDDAPDELEVRDALPRGGEKP